MSKPPTFFKKTTNEILRLLAKDVRVGDALPPEQQLADACQASRTVVRRAIAHLRTRRIISGSRTRLIERLPEPADYFDETEAQSTSERIQLSMMEQVFQSDLQPGAEFTESELARLSGASTVSVREFVIGFSRYGLIEKKPRRGWRLCAFDVRFAKELADTRELFEIAAVKHICSLPPSDPAFAKVARLIEKHEQLAPHMKTRFQEFPPLDREFHTFLIGLLENRFARDFFDVVSFVFHYHYQWRKDDEMVRNEYALQEHLRVLKAIAQRDTQLALDNMEFHLKSARSSLLRSLNTLGRTGE